MTIRPEKLVVTSNYFPSQCFSNPEDIGPILRRFRVIDDLADLPPIPDQVPPELQEPWGEQPEAPELEQVPEAGEEEQVPEAREEEQMPETREGLLVQEAQAKRKRDLEQVVSREEQVSREADGGVQYEEGDLSGQRDQRCNQQ